ncbi:MULTISPECIES: hypothetical protein [Curtobacterium]|nr:MULTISPECIES: hypothetical protein [Curtobacterium]MCS6565388.1 hypothetical protein [Curtobacterium flaccumfaciens pv. flaccumfaciens]MCU0114438.1 hypothetical protein [Curtobacterium flaccumfaciens]
MIDAPVAVADEVAVFVAKRAERAERAERSGLTTDRSECCGR